VGDGGTSGSLGSGAVSNDGALVFNRSDGIEVGGTISGTGSLTQAGSGTLTLTGNNTYSGGTTISTGTLQVGNSGTIGSLGSGDVSNNGALVFKRSDTNVVSNSISGTGSLTQAGAGTLTLLGTNTYSGSTFISAGTLQVGDGGTLGSLGSGDVTNNSVLAFNHNDGIVVSNAISGSGTLIQAGAGTLILAASNTYSGRTIISAGTLQVGDGGTIGSLGSGAVSNNSILVFNRSDSIVASNTINGTGSLTQAGAGTLTLAANNTYSGGTIIEAGTLQVGNGSSSGSLGSGAVSNNSALVFNRSDGILVTNFISGVGSLTHGGTGTLTLTNNNTYSGGTWINNGGTLAVQDSHALGSGDLNLVNGTLNVNTMVINVGGNYTQASTGTLEIAVGGTGTFGQLNIAGTASLTGTLHIVTINSYVPMPNDTFVVLVASNGVSGTFSNSISSPSVLLGVDVAYHANDVTLTWEQESFVPFAHTQNQRAVARNLDAVAFATSSSAEALINYLDFVSDPTNSLPRAYDQIAPEELTALFTVSLAGMDSQANQFLKRANALRAGYRGLYIDLYNANASVGNEAQIADRPWGVYLETVGQFVNVSGDANASGYDLSGGGLTVGVDRRINDQLVLGGALSYVSDQVDLTHNGNIDAEGGLAQLYAVWFKQGLHLEGLLGGDMNSCDTKRQGVQGYAKGSTDGLGWTGLLSGGYDWQNGPWSFGPQSAIQYESASFDSFKEKGSLAPLSVKSQSAEALYSQLGATLRYRHYVTGTWTFITPELNVAWRHDYLDNSFGLRSRLADGSGNAFTVHGPELGSDSAVVNLGTTVQWTAAWSTHVNGTVQFGQDGYQAQYISGGLRLSF
jgi:outer membrane autotransporter protein